MINQFDHIWIEVWISIKINIRMKNIVVASFFMFLSQIAFGQDETLGQKIDDITFKWDYKSKELNSYEGLSKFCLEKEYREDFISMLHDIHHYDSVLYQRLLKASRISDSKEISKAIKDIEKFEESYSMKKFMHFLHDECQDRNDIEKHAKELKSEIGSESYSGQIYIIENELNKYIKHITARVDHIRKHVHHLHVK
ncbi:MAG: hypothetical protein ACJA08_000655 [Cyclobacteriaceae bacterium]